MEASKFETKQASPQISKNKSFQEENQDKEENISDSLMNQQAEINNQVNIPIKKTNTIDDELLRAVTKKNEDKKNEKKKQKKKSKKKKQNLLVYEYGTPNLGNQALNYNTNLHKQNQNCINYKPDQQFNQNEVHHDQFHIHKVQNSNNQCYENFANKQNPQGDNFFNNMNHMNADYESN